MIWYILAVPAGISLLLICGAISFSIVDEALESRKKQEKTDKPKHG